MKIATIQLIIVTIIWGSGFIATEFAMQAGWKPVPLMALRFSLAALILLLVLHRRIKLISRAGWRWGAAAGCFLFTAFILQTIGQANTTVSNTAFFTATNVIMIPFISWALTRKRPGVQTILLAFVTVLGVFVLNFRKGGFSFSIGDGLVLLCAFFFAMHIAVLERATAEEEPDLVNFVQILTAAILALAVFGVSLLMGATYDFTAMVRAQGLLSAGYLGVVSTCLCYFLQTRAQETISAGRAGVILSLEGVFGSLFSVLLGFEAMRVNLVVGGGLIVLATILVNIDLSHKLVKNSGEEHDLAGG